MEARAKGEGANILELKDIYKDFEGLEVLKGITLDIQEGERHAIIGPNGAGKSTLYNLITGKYRPSRGRIFFRGNDITGKNPFRINRLGMARSFQITNLFATMTVFENVRNVVLTRNNAYYNPFSRLDKMREITERTEGILNQIGLFTRRDDVAGELSYGQQRALEIGLTIASDPELILLDEPTAGMSTDETRETVKLISRITEGKTLMIVEHDMDVVFSLANRITVIYYGKVLATGLPAEIRQSQEVKDAYLGEEKEEG
jgi:branched-chain amino acid transport system ATP-binding protein